MSGEEAWLKLQMNGTKYITVNKIDRVWKESGIYCHTVIDGMNDSWPFLAIDITQIHLNPLTICGHDIHWAKPELLMTPSYRSINSHQASSLSFILHYKMGTQTTMWETPLFVNPNDIDLIKVIEKETISLKAKTDVLHSDWLNTKTQYEHVCDLLEDMKNYDKPFGV